MSLKNMDISTQSSKKGSTRGKKPVFSENLKEKILAAVQKKRDQGMTIPDACDAVRKELKLDFSNASYNLWQGESKGKDYLGKYRSKKRLEKKQREYMEALEAGALPDVESKPTLDLTHHHTGNGNNDRSRMGLITATIGDIKLEGTPENIANVISRLKGN